MFKHVLIPTDGSELSMKGVLQGLSYAKEANARVTALMATYSFQTFAYSPESVNATPESYRKAAHARATETLNVVSEAAKAAGVPCETIIVEANNPWEAIVRTARDRGCDLIAMASHGRRGAAALLLGSETTKVLTHSTIPVL